MENNNVSLTGLSEGRIIPKKEKICFGFGILANVIITGIVGLYLTDYYINKIQIRYELFIIAQVIFLFWNALNDIFFAYIADRTKHRLGRRIPYIRYGAPLFAASFIFFWFPLPGSAPGDLNSGQTLKFIQLLIGLLFYDTMLTIVILSLVALPPEMSESTTERTSIGIYTLIFTLIGGITILVVPIIMSLGLEIFRISILILAAIATLAYLILSYGVKERFELHEKEFSEKYNILTEIKIAFKNKSFISFLIFNFCVVFTLNLSANFTPFYTTIFGLEEAWATVVLVSFYTGYV
ncbi:MAG: hypothetical protein EU539_12795, partial [Promethearchaeota archaeon]